PGDYLVRVERMDRQGYLAVARLHVRVGLLGSPAGEAKPGIVNVEFIFEKAAFPQCHASTLVETKEGLVAAWFGGTREKNPDVGIWVSRRAGNTWTAPVQVADGKQ